MPALEAPPAPVERPAPRSETDLASVSFSGRSLVEYVQFLALDVPSLRGRDLLDVGSGCSSFTAEACARRIHAVAVDSLYGRPPAEVAQRAARELEGEFAAVRLRRRSFRIPRSASLADLELERRASVQRFLADYETHFIHSRYVCGALPLLPFFDQTFDVVLCANLLFHYGTRFDYDWHLAACRELVRVSATEVRIYPVCGGDGRTYAALSRLRRELKEAGVASELRTVAYEYVPGANVALFLRRARP